MKVLITGGAGYIGSITAHEMTRQGFEVVIYDSLENGYKESIKDFKLIEGNIKDGELLIKTLKKEKIEAVIHFAAYIQMGESMKNPFKYFENNLVGSQQLAQSMISVEVKKMVFSSTAGVYGNPERVPIKEEDRKLPENPYGESKLMVEKMLEWYDKIHDLKSISLRYFNASGASLDGKLGEAHQPESHLIPNVIKSIIKDKEFNLFGDDYSTPDGTCIRDYIHVVDLAQAHILALKALDRGHKSDVLNAGTGKGYSNRQVMEMVEKVSGKKLKVKVLPRRPGDANTLVADNGKIKKELRFAPKYSDLKTIVESAWKWHNLIQ